MASVPVVLQRVRRARRRAAAGSASGRFREYEPEYESILAALEEVAGDDALDEVAAWAIDETRRQERLPTPSELRAQAREVCRDRDRPLPEGGPLAV